MYFKKWLVDLGYILHTGIQEFLSVLLAKTKQFLFQKPSRLFNAGFTTPEVFGGEYESDSPNIHAEDIEGRLNGVE